MVATPHDTYTSLFGADGAFLYCNVPYAMISATLGLAVADSSLLMGCLVDLAEQTLVVIAMLTSNDPTRITFYTSPQSYPTDFGNPGPLNAHVFAIGGNTRN